ncbi:MAG: hydantoinase/oxoprolinase family protein, partial [Pirellulaceae bacterium]
ELVASVAAANWHALARYAARFGNGPFQLHVDIGSTTTDIIPIRDGLPPAKELTDTERLTRGELVYAGVRRTPISSLVSELPWRGLEVPVARELFATTLDAFLLLGELPGNPEDRETADGQPATIEYARARMARMICACPADCSTEDVVPMAGKVVSELRQLIVQALEKVLATAGAIPETILLSGEGSFLGRQVVEQARVTANLLQLDDLLSPPEAAVAPAVAVAVLASEEVTP